MKIVVAGHICLDIIPNWLEGNFNSLKPGHIIEMNGIDVALGGAVPNAGFALNNLGFPVKMIGKIGQDVLGKIVENKIQNRSSNQAESILAKSENRNTSYTVVLSPPDADRLFLHDPGVNDIFTSRDIDFSLLQDYSVFHFGYPPIMKNICQDDAQELKAIYQRARKNNFITSLDLAMPAPNSSATTVNWEHVFGKILPLVDIFMPSLEELIFMLDNSTYQAIFNDKSKEITGEYLKKISKKLLDFGVKIVVLKLGELGIYMRSKKFSCINSSPLQKHLNMKKWSDRMLYSSNFKVKVKGTTGAGDCAVAGFLAGLLKNYSPEQALNLAAAAGACCVEEIDATSGLQSLSDIEKRINSGWKRHPKKITLNNC